MTDNAKGDFTGAVRCMGQGSFAHPVRDASLFGAGTRIDYETLGRPLAFSTSSLFKPVLTKANYQRLCISAALISESPL